MNQPKKTPSEERRDKQLRDDLVELLRHPWGRRLAYWLIYIRCHAMGAVFDYENTARGYATADLKEGETARLHMAVREGARHVGIDLWSLMHGADLESCQLMMNEAYDELRTDIQLDALTNPSNRRDP